MAKKKSAGAKDADQVAKDQKAGAPSASEARRGELLAEPPPKNPITATLDRGDNQLILQYKRPIAPETYHPEDFRDGLVQTFEWRAAWLRAIALSWASDQLREKLCKNPYSFLLEHCGYAVPQTVQLAIVDDQESQFVKPEEDNNNWEWHLTRSVLVLYLPKKPAVQDQAIALAAYESVGSTYPFTVTC